MCLTVARPTERTLTEHQHMTTFESGIILTLICSGLAIIWGLGYIKGRHDAQRD